MSKPPKVMPITPRTTSLRRARGFSLIELMIVISIIAVLATIAGVAFGKYSRAAKTQRARAMLLAIAGAETNEDPYVGSGTNLSFCPPVAIVSSRMTDWPTACESSVWLTLGIPRPNQTRFAYSISAGGASDTCAMGSPYCASVTNGERWWVAVAHGDLDGDGVRSTFITSYSMNGAIYANNEFE